MYSSPPDLWNNSWEQLAHAVHHKQHPFRTPTLCTRALDGSPHARVLVLRKLVEQSELWCYTDARSQKVQELKQYPRVQWLFWNPAKQLQIALSGQARLLDTIQTAEIFKQLPKYSRKTYAALHSPGSFLDQASDGLPPYWEKATLSETDYAQKNFCVLLCTLEKADILSLDKTGHKRLQATRDQGGAWQWQWVVP